MWVCDWLFSLQVLRMEKSEIILREDYRRKKLNIILNEFMNIFLLIVFAVMFVGNVLLFGFFVIL